MLGIWPLGHSFSLCSSEASITAFGKASPASQGAQKNPCVTTVTTFRKPLALPSQNFFFPLPKVSRGVTWHIKIMKSYKLQSLPEVSKKYWIKSVSVTAWSAAVVEETLWPPACWVKKGTVEPQRNHRFNILSSEVFSSHLSWTGTKTWKAWEKLCNLWGSLINGSLPHLSHQQVPLVLNSILGMVSRKHCLGSKNGLES